MEQMWPSGYWLSMLEKGAIWSISWSAISWNIKWTLFLDEVEEYYLWKFSIHLWCMFGQAYGYGKHLELTIEDLEPCKLNRFDISSWTVTYRHLVIYSDTCMMFLLKVDKTLNLIGSLSFPASPRCRKGGNLQHCFFLECILVSCFKWQGYCPCIWSSLWGHSDQWQKCSCSTDEC